MSRYSMLGESNVRLEKARIKLAKRVLREKYNESFDVSEVGKGFGTLMNDTFTVSCRSTKHSDIVFKAEIEKEGMYVLDDYIPKRMSKRWRMRCG